MLGLPVPKARRRTVWSAVMRMVVRTWARPPRCMDMPDRRHTVDAHLEFLFVHTLRSTGRNAMLAPVLILGLASCGAPQNQGTSGGRMEPDTSASSEVGSRQLGSRDLVTATDRMAMDIASRLDVTNAQSPPRIVVGHIENRTSRPEADYQVFLARLRAVLNASGARHGLDFVRERDYIEAQRDREYGGKDIGSSSIAYRSMADYMLTAEVFDLPSGDSRYYLVDFQLVQLREAQTGPNVGPGAIVWENLYEVKFP